MLQPLANLFLLMAMKYVVASVRSVTLLWEMLMLEENLVMSPMTRIRVSCFSTIIPVRYSIRATGITQM